MSNNDRNTALVLLPPVLQIWSKTSKSRIQGGVIGTVVSHYKILQKLGGGGMGVVYEAEDTRLGRRVALKFLPSEMSRSADATERFRREARAASALNHPGICTIYDIGEHDGTEFIVMEMLEGKTLKHQLDNGPLPPELVMDFSIQIAEALTAAHARGILHRDIKPANIFLTQHAQAKVLDFGLAKLALQPQLQKVSGDDITIAVDRTLTQVGGTVGTVAYMSPEQARGEELDVRTDIFSFGAVLYEMVTGRQAFEGQTSAVIFDKILHYKPVAPVRFSPEVSPELERIVGTSLEKDRNLRYQSATALAADLKRLRRDSTSPGPQLVVTSEPREGAGKLRRSPTRRYLMIGVLAMIVLAAAAILAGTLWLRSGAVDSIAVLPFTVIGDRPGLKEISDAVTEGVTNGISQDLNRVRVMARSTVPAYTPGKDDPRTLGRQLNVGAVLIGRVLPRADNKVHVEGELIRVSDGVHLWGDHYTVAADDIGSAEEHLAHDVSDSVHKRNMGVPQQAHVHSEEGHDHDSDHQ
jgi:serine/threonine protein kinase